MINKKIYLSVVIIALVFILIIGVIIVSQNKDNTLLTTNNAQGDISTDMTDNLAIKDFEGKYISAEIPENWSIVEYYDNEGTRNINNGNSILKMEVGGLTGIAIKNEYDDTIFNLAGTGGIGGMSVCRKLYLFSDTDQNYIEKLKAQNEAVPNIEMEIIDLTETEYTEINLLGNRLRRVGNKLYSSDDNSTTNFNTKCWVGGNDTPLKYIPITVLSYASTEVPEYVFHTYYFGFNPEITMSEEELKKLDSVLNSLEINN